MGGFRFPAKHDITAPFQSRGAFVDFLKAPQANEGHVAIGDSKWSNKDLEPTPEEHRNWTWYVSRGSIVELD